MELHVTEIKRARKSGFVLIELLVAMSILVIITAMVYSTFATVTDSALMARTGAEETRHHLFLMRHFLNNITSAYSDPLYGTDGNELFRFIGEEDSLVFVTTAPVTGGMTLPGEIKQIKYELTTASSSETEDVDDALMDDEDKSSSVLKITEVPFLAGMIRPNELDAEMDSGGLEPDSNYEAPELPEIPIESLKFRYHDGEEWLDTYDVDDYGHFPWAVEVQINFSKISNEELNSDVVVEGEDIQFHLVIPISLGMGITTEIFTVLGDEQMALDDLEGGEDLRNMRDKYVSVPPGV